MIVGHIDPKPILQFEAGSREIVETERGRFPITKRSIKIVFEPLEPGIPTRTINTRFESGRLLSKIDTEKVAAQLGVTDEALCTWLRAHPSWNERMIRVDEDSTDAVGDEGSGDGITANGDGSFTCTVCDNKYLKDGRGLYGHTKSQAHKDALAAHRELLMESVA